MNIPYSVILVAVAGMLLGGCGEKEKPPEPSTPISPPTSQAPIVAPGVPPPPIALPPATEPAPAPAPSSAQPATDMAATEEAMRKSDCMTCHLVDKKLIGPAYSWVAYRYKDDKDAVEKLAATIKKGGMGNWNAYTGGVPMTPHPQLSDETIRSMVLWVLNQTPVEPPKL